jgi:hypothetical protein
VLYDVRVTKAVPIEGVDVLPLAAGVVVRIAREPAPAALSPGTRALAEWERLCALNPRLHDGPILSVVSVDATVGEVFVRRDSFQRLIIQPRVMTGVRLLGVTGVLTARDASGREFVLLGRRAEGVRVYAGMWEVGPSGGVGVPPMGVEELTVDHLTSYLADEALEEVGVEIISASPVALVRDLIAFSDDVVLRTDLGEVDIDRLAPASWEYAQARWMPVDEIAAFDASRAQEIIAPTRAIFRMLGWV